MFVPHSKKAFSDILEGVTSISFSLAPLAGLIPSFFCVTCARNVLVMQLKILQVFYWRVSLAVQFTILHL